MSLPGISRFFRSLFLFPLFLSASCGSAQVLGIPRQEAAELLKKGDILFIRQAELPSGFSGAVSRLKELSLIHSAASFYAGLLAGGESAAHDSSPALETLLFCAALESPSLPARQEAVLKLIPIVLEAEGTGEARNILGLLDSRNLKENEALLRPLRAACLYRLDGEKGGPPKPEAGRPSSDGGEKDAGHPWERALALFAAWRASPGESETPEAAKLKRELKQEIEDFLFEAPPGEALRWAVDEASSLGGGILDPAALGVLSARLLPANYRAVLNNARPALQDGGDIFLRYPNLIPDLGRAFQYTPAVREEGAALFRAWAEKNDLPKPEASRLFPILFYVGRIERARENYRESSEYFERALEFAPDAAQSDACIWYMLMNALAGGGPSPAASLARSTMPRWSDVSYFADILDRLSAYFTGKRQWDELLDIFQSLESKGSSGPLAQYAWILGRAVEEGYVTAGRGAESFFRLAYGTEEASFYYRAMAASKLGISLAPAGEGSGEPEAAFNPEADFILGFFECGASSFLPPYLEAREDSLSVGELRNIAGAYESSLRWKEQLDFVSRYTRRKGYVPGLRDLYLSHPRPFLEPVERYANEAGLGAEILYALIRTESYFMHEVVSRSGAVGLAQVMPPTAADMAGRIARQGGPDYRRPEGVDLKDPEINIHIGSYYLRYLNEQTGSPMLALLSYNGGMGRVRRWLAASGGLPHDLFLETVEYTETREYGRRVMAAAAVYGHLYYGMSMEEVTVNSF